MPVTKASLPLWQVMPVTEALLNARYVYSLLRIEPRRPVVRPSIEPEYQWEGDYGT